MSNDFSNDLEPDRRYFQVAYRTFDEVASVWLTIGGMLTRRFGMASSGPMPRTSGLFAVEVTVSSTAMIQAGGLLARGKKGICDFRTNSSFSFLQTHFGPHN